MMSQQRQQFPRRILLIGANGWLAQFLHHRLLEASFPVSFLIYTTYHSTKPFWLNEELSYSMNLEDEESVKAVITTVKPDIVLHLAAMTSPVRCHQDPALAQSINSPSHLMEIVKTVSPHALYIFTSTDMVYDGNSAPYDPVSDPSPVNVYGKTKLDYEHQLLKNLPNAIILRLSNMLGPRYQYNPCGEKFLEFLSKAFQKRELIGLKSDEIRCFVNVDDVVELILRIMERYFTHSQKDSSSNWMPDSCRIYNVGGPAGLSRVDLAETLCKLYQTNLIIFKDRAHYALHAPSAGEDAQVEGVEDESFNENNWKVFLMASSTSPVPPPPSSLPPATTPNDTKDTNNNNNNNNNNSVVITSVGSVINPRDISMNIQKTEKDWGIHFKPAIEYLRSHVEKKL
jgi:dTDP-4-dehydrorhamnose reductase